MCNAILSRLCSPVSTLVTGLLMAISVTAQAGPNDKCATEQMLPFTPTSTVTEGTDVTLTQDVTTTSLGTGNGVCGLAIGDHVNDGIMRIHLVTAGGTPLGCSYLNKKFCTVGESVNPDGTCQNQNDCLVDVGNGVCTTVTSTGAGNLLAEENPTNDGTQSVLLSTDGLGGSVLGFVGTYVGQNNFLSATDNCKDLTVLVDEGGGDGDGECESGLTIDVDLTSGTGRPAAPGGPYNWTYEVKVHACEDLYGVTAQGGTNGWAPLANNRDELLSLHPSAGTSAKVRKANKQADIILWTIGDMLAGDDATLGVDLTGSIKNVADCQMLFLSGPWSAMHSTDGFVFAKTDYTGRVFVKADTDGDPGDCDL